MNNTKLVELQNQHIKGVTLKLIWTVIVSTVIITSSVLGTLFSLKSEMQMDRMNAKLRESSVDGKFERLEMKVDNTKADSDKRLTYLENFLAKQ